MTAESEPNRGGSPGGERASALDRSREKLQLRKGLAEDRAAEVRALDEQIDAISAQSRRHETALAAALDGVAVLKKAIRSAEKQNEKLRRTRTAARSIAAKAREHADTAETKCDRAVLADVLRREKNSDLAAHGVDPAQRSPDTAAEGHTSPAVTRDRPAAPGQGDPAGWR